LTLSRHKKPQVYKKISLFINIKPAKQKGFLTLNFHFLAVQPPITSQRYTSMLTNVISDFALKNCGALKLISWKYTFKRLNEEYEIAKKKKKALDNLYETGKISASTRDSFAGDITMAIVEIEKQRKELVEKMALKTQELESQIKMLETLLANYEIQHVIGEIEEEIYQREINLLATSLETTKSELNIIKQSTDQLNPPEAIEAPAIPEPVAAPIVETAQAAPVEIPVEAAPVETAPVEPTPVETAAVEIPVETTQAEVAPVENAPAEATVEVAPVEEAAVEVAIEAAPVEMPVEAAPVEAAPAEAIVEVTPIEAAPVEEAIVETAPVEAAPQETVAPEQISEAVVIISPETEAAVAVEPVIVEEAVQEPIVTVEEAAPIEAAPAEIIEATPAEATVEAAPVEAPAEIATPTEEVAEPVQEQVPLQAFEVTEAAPVETTLEQAIEEPIVEPAVEQIIVEDLGHTSHPISAPPQAPSETEVMANEAPIDQAEEDEEKTE